jgi:hypothetical protein
MPNFKYYKAPVSKGKEINFIRLNRCSNFTLSRLMKGKLYADEAEAMKNCVIPFRKIKAQATEILWNRKYV